MMKKTWTRLALVLSVTGLLGCMTACGKGETQQKTANTEGEQKQEEKQEESTSTEYVYQVSEQELTTNITNFSNMCEWKDQVYMLGTGYKTDESTGEYSSHCYLLECDADGTQTKETEVLLGENESILTMAVCDDDKIHVLTDETDEDDNESYSVKILGEDGTLQEDHALSAEKGVYLRNQAVIKGDGSVYGMDMSSVYYFNEAGKQKKTYDPKAYPENLILTEDGDVYVYGSFGDDGSHALRKVDEETQKLGEPIALDYDVSNVEASETGGMIYMQNSKDVYCVDTAQGKEDIILNWINSDVDGDEIMCFLPVQQGERLLAVARSYENGDDPARMLVVNKVEASSVKEKKVLTLACTNVYGDVKDSILEFNKENENYRIEVKDYSAYDDFRTKLNLDIVSGEVPDILFLTDLPVDMYIKKGILTDLYPLMEADSEISKEDFLDSYLKVLEQDGKLYYMGSTFQVNVYGVGKKYLDTPNWTFEDMKELYENKSKQQIFLYNMSREFFLQQMVLGQMSSFVNWETGEVSLDSEEFTDMLEFSNYFPGQEEESDSVDMVKAVKKGNLMAASLHLSGVYDIEVLTQLYKNAGGFQITGYPSGDSDNTVSIDFGNPAMAITEQCEDKEGAWEFLRYFLTKEKQVSYALGIMGGMLNGLPVRKDAFEKALEYAMATESYTDENGMEINPIASNYLYEECELSIGPVSEEEAEQVRDIVDRIGAVSMENDVVSGQITDIIQEEAEAFYAGDKTAAEVAEIVQSRVKLFVSENS